MSSSSVKPATSSPLKPNTGRSPFSSTTDKRDGRMEQVEIETRGKWRGPVSPQEFLDQFLPAATGRPGFHSEEFKVPDLGTPGFEEKKMYEPLAKAFQRFAPDLDVAITAKSFGSSPWEYQQYSISPDMSLYAKGTSRPRVELPDIEAFFEFKKDVKSTGFDDNGAFEKRTQDSNETRSQLATYAGAIMAVQFRTHIFAVEVTGENARLLRFDREGCIVTEKFSYVKDSYLADFLWRFNHASPETRGHDKSVTTPSAAEAPWVVLARQVLKMGNTAKVWRFEVFDEASKQTIVFYGGVIVAHITAVPFGRCTRGFYVVTVDGKKVYLKDTWRIDLPEIDKEGVVYEKLHAAHVPHVPHVVAHGDALGDWQKTASALDRFQNLVHERPYRHYFIVFQEIGRDLESFKTIWELVNAMKCAIRAHKDAFMNAKILHRDISVGNILISEDGTEGFLIDWDFSKPVTNEIPRQSERTGTWQFMSARLLKEPHSLHTRADDLESFFHVLSYVILRLGNVSIGTRDILQHLNAVYDYVVIYEGTTSGGKHKRSALVESFMAATAGISNECLRNLATEFETLVAVRYIQKPSEDDRMQYNAIAAAMNYDEKNLNRQPVWKYDKSMERLEDWSWIYEQFCKATEDPSKLSDGPNKTGLKALQDDKQKLLILGRAVGGSSKRGATDDLSPERASQRPRNG